MRLSLELEMNSLASFRLTGVDGGTFPLVPEIEPPKSCRVSNQVIRPSDLVDSNAHQVTKPNVRMVKTSTQPAGGIVSEMLV